MNAPVPPADARVLLRVVLGAAESLPWSLLLEGPDRRVLAANRRFRNLLRGASDPDAGAGADARELWKRLSREMEAPDLFLHGVEERLHSGRAVTGEAIRLGDGRTLARDYVPLMGEDGTLRAHLWLYEDVTEERRADHERMQAGKLEAVGQLAGGLAHDLNNALTTILGHASLLGLELGQRRDLMESLTEIERAAGRAATLTRNLLAFSRRQMLQPTLVDPAAVVRRIEDLLVRILGPDIELELELPAEPAGVRVDPLKLEHALLHLAVNAREAMPGGGRLSVIVAGLEVEGPASGGPALPPGEYVLISVTDTGSGIPEERRANLFQPFFSPDPAQVGTGLGLSMVYGFVKQSGGSVWAEGDDGGATIRIALPRVSDAPAAAHVPPPAAPAASEAGPATILVADDEPGVLSLVRRALERRGHRVLTAIDGAEALALAEAQGSRLDLLVTDAVMPRMTGVELARRVREMDPGLPVLFISGFSVEVVHHLESTEGVSLLEKPFLATDVVEAVEGMLEQGARTATED